MRRTVAGHAPSTDSKDDSVRGVGAACVPWWTDRRSWMKAAGTAVFSQIRLGNHRPTVRSDSHQQRPWPAPWPPLLIRVFLCRRKSGGRNVLCVYGPTWRRMLMRTCTIAVAAAVVTATPIVVQQAAAQNQQSEADKGVKTRNSGESGYVGEQGKAKHGCYAAWATGYSQQFSRRSEFSECAEFRNWHHRRSRKQEWTGTGTRHGRLKPTERARPAAGPIRH